MSDNDTTKEHIVAVAVRDEKGDVEFAPVMPMEYFDKYNIRVSVSYDADMSRVMKIERFNPKPQHICFNIDGATPPPVRGPFWEGFSQETKEAVIESFDGKRDWIEARGMIFSEVISGKAKPTHKSAPWERM